MIYESYVAIRDAIDDARSLVVDAGQWPQVEAALIANNIEYWGWQDFTADDGAYCVGVSVRAEDMERVTELLGAEWAGYTGNAGARWKWLAFVVGLLSLAILFGAAAMALGVMP